MPKRTPQDWETMEAELHAAGVSPAEIEAGARKLLAEARGHRLAEAQRHLGFTQKDIAAAMSVSIARVSQIEHGEVASFEVIARYVDPHQFARVTAALSRSLGIADREDEL